MAVSIRAVDVGKRTRKEKRRERRRTGTLGIRRIVLVIAVPGSFLIHKAEQRGGWRARRDGVGVNNLGWEASRQGWCSDQWRRTGEGMKRMGRMRRMR